MPFTHLRLYGGELDARLYLFLYPASLPGSSHAPSRYSHPRVSPSHRRVYLQVPLDGIVVHGSALVSIQHITGEALPVLKRVGDEVPAGAVNSDGALVVVVNGCQRCQPSDRLDAAYTRGKRSLADDPKKSNIACTLNVRAAAELKTIGADPDRAHAP